MNRKSIWADLCAGAAIGSLAIAPQAFAQLQSPGNLPQGSPVTQQQNPSGSGSQGNGTQQQQQQQQNPYLGNQPLRPQSLTEPADPRFSLLFPQQEQVNEGPLKAAPAKPGEFEEYITRVLGRRLPRYGDQLLLPSLRDFAAPATATVPPDYVVQPGDKIVIALSGSVDGSVEREVDTDGKIFLSGVGSIRVAGVRNSDLRRVISQAVGTQFRGFTVAVNVKELRGIRVYVTGFANNPGAFTVSSLSTMANAVFQAGGPASGGSFRSIKLYRNGQEVGDFDLYELIRGGSRITDIKLQNEDVLFIPPAGEQIAVVGSVNQEAIYEAKPGESVAEMIAAAGGGNSLADMSRVILYRTRDPSNNGPQQIPWSAAGARAVQGADILQVLSTGSLTKPIDRQSVLVRVEGEVNKPGIYYVSPNTPTNEVIAMAGGLTPSAYPYGTQFTRHSVKLQQQENFREAVRQLELALAAAPLTADSSQTEGDRASQLAGANAVLERLREAEPDGRVVLPIAPDAVALPGEILLQNNDAIYVPAKATTVGVFGAVYRPASFLVGGPGGLRVRDYVELAGGTVRAADGANTIVVRANGEILSRKRGALSARVLPGDVIFVPIRTRSGSIWAKVKDITQTIFQLGLSAATIVSVTR